MAIESISKSGMAYQGSVSAPEVANVATERPEPVAAESIVIKQSGDGQVLSKGTGRDKAKEENYGQASNEAVKKAVEELNKNIKNSEAIFGIHDETNRVTIKIVDKESKEVIKEYPPEKTLDMIAKVWEMAGIMVDEKR